MHFVLSETCRSLVVLSLVNIEGAQALKCVYQLKTAWGKQCCELMHCLHAVVLPQIQPFFTHSFSQLGQDLDVVLLINRLTLSYPFHYDHIPVREIITITFSFDLLVRAFIGVGDVWVLQCTDCLFVSGLNWKIHVSLHVMTFSSKSRCSLIFSMMSE